MERKTAVISGGMGAVGQAVAQALAAQGHRVALLYRSNLPEEVVAFLAALSEDDHRAMCCDITQEAEVRTAVDAVWEAFGRIDVCVHAAADPIARGKVENLSSETFRSQFEANLFGGFNLFKHVFPIMKERGGLMVGITSAVLETGGGAMPGYTAAKAALRALLRDLAKEGAPVGIRVNAIAPDLMRTKLTADLPPRLFEFQSERDPRGRITEPRDVAEKLLFLLSPKGASLSGMSLRAENDVMSPL